MKFLPLSILFLFVNRAFCQEDIPAKMAVYASCKNSDQLFVHTDKHIYTNNEYIWFSGWLLNCGNDSMPLHRLLSLTLVPADTRIPGIQQKFFMNNGYSYGSMQLPDSIAPGEYKLIAYTNVMGPDSLPLALFTQDLSVRSIRTPDFVASATMLEDTTGKKELLIAVRNKENYQPIAGAELWLWCANSKTIKAITDKRGTYRLNLSLVDPGSAASAIIITKVKYHDEISYLQNKWPQKTMDRQLDMRFYPEGGYLVANAICTIGWESKTSAGEPVTTRAVVFDNQQPIDTITTNEQGLGKFYLTVHPGASYAIKPIAWPAELQLKIEGYSLPVVLTKGVAISVPHAIINDSLFCKVFASGYSQVNLVVHNFRTVFQQQVLAIKEGGTRVLLLLDDVPKGLTAITLLDSNDRPLAERIFFAHYNSKTVCTITPDKKAYEKRQKVTVSFQLNNNEQPVEGFASVACAQANRYDYSKHQDIESFTYLHGVLQNVPDYTNGEGYKKEDHLEKVLLVRGWRRYTWQELMANKQPPASFYEAAINGKVIPAGKIKKPITIAILNGNSTLPYTITDLAGNFACTYEQLGVDQGKKLWISDGDKYSGHKVTMLDPFTDINKKLATRIHFNSIDANRYLQYANDLALSDLKKVKSLAVVTVTAHKNNDNSLWGASANACGDFICPWGILNCRNHGGFPGNRLPEKGKLYDINGGGKVTYWGCALEEPSTAAAILQYEGIKMGKELYQIGEEEAAGAAPLFVSTIYWSPSLVFDKTGKATAGFNTGDITGRFRIVVNGMAGNTVFYSTGTIDVK